MVAFFKNKKKDKIKIISSTKVKTELNNSSTEKGKIPPIKNIFITNCTCCGTSLHLPEKVPKFKCAVCHTIVYLPSKDVDESENKDDRMEIEFLEAFNYDRFIKILEDCDLNYLNNRNKTKDRCSIFYEPLISYLTEKLDTVEKINKSFISDEPFTQIDFKQLFHFYKKLVKLPTRKPLYTLMHVFNTVLRKPGKPLLLKDKNNDLAELHWIFIIWLNPILKDCLIYNSKRETRLLNGKFFIPEINSISYELIKRSIGYISNIVITNSIVYKQLVKYFKHLPLQLLINDIERVNLYVTFQFNKIIYSNTKDTANKRESKLFNKPINNTNNTNNNNINNNSMTNQNVNNIDNIWSSDEITSDILAKLNGRVAPCLQGFKFKSYEYDSNWHIRTASNLLRVLYIGNEERNENKITSSSFYNILLDFIDFKQDFENWRKLRNISRRSTLSSMENWELLEINSSHGYALCQYPFLLSLGLKISILGYEVRRIMEFKAEQAFLKSLDKGRTVDVYFKIKVRRSHITHDSLNYIKNHPQDLLKSLRVEFVDEPGVDAGGLRKEWFILLTRKLFDPMNGLFIVNEESRLAWFSIQPHDFDEQNDELFYLFGVILGLAIFNSTILDLRFPKAFYKKLIHEPLSFVDYAELYPENAKNLLKLCAYNEDDFCEVFDLTFETTFESSELSIENNGDRSGEPKRNKITVELCEGGKNIQVTNENKNQFIKLWFNFYMNKSIERQYNQFEKGFHEVFSQCDCTKLFNSEELERLACGDNEQDSIDIMMLRSVTKYIGGYNDQSQVISWFWEILQGWDHKLQKKMLQFVTGSDRIPATGISTLPFKIARVGPNLHHVENGLLEEPLPTAHTCFNEICLWDYKSKEELERRLIYSISESEGFGFK
ncbi:hypothetical protein Kpol_1067p30 [Vanderwaltozyma polyspora DSM 70294]|uniref:HECT-type E3 ubiquitin transferase n=1 Tax=Vanderwaltozyma polyspora (strain ATCC 22028 / DSM 70294 / BCRC 21397 / CBS 2163 / NBRC 10782 / NRRL Y-8283 / UCD 57-17) TaxID=436907 RepID=A7TNX4_VANPO|nr:uncharacterized protein Kpol_1067p30 [Vanderwaltozyma polyspora DSM 70294]EDO16057.1 hypothetical protein Kpol_1067p30 [Vanderwaltozyma polyspora DSM 70294]